MSVCLLQALCQTHHPEDAEELTKFLPEDRQRQLEQIEGHATPIQVLESIEGLPSFIHYSWLAEFLKKEREEMKSLYLGALPTPLATTLGTNIAPLSKPLKAFFLAALIRQLQPANILPVCCLPASPLNELVKMRKRALVRLIGYLGLRDFAQATKRVIDQQTIQHLRGLLTESQQHYLDRCMQESDPLLSEFSIHKCDQTELARLLQLQGLRRMGRALSHESPSLIWHLAHHLDRGRGELILSEAKQRLEQSVAERLKRQIIDLMDMLT